MSLGGYKFRGYYCQKGSLTDAQWVALIHKTRTKAFIAANTASNAGWVPQTDGNTAFESYGNILHDLGSSLNWLTIFTNGTDSLAIVTLSRYCFGGGTETTGTVKVTNFVDFGRSAYKYFCPFVSCSHVAAHGELNSSNVLLLGDNTRSQLLTIGAPNIVGSSTPANSDSHTVDMTSTSATIGSTTVAMNDNYLNNYTKISFGYAIKGKNLITFAKGGTNSSVEMTVLGLDSFSSVIDSNDTNRFFYMNLSGVNNTNSAYKECGRFDDAGWNDVQEQFVSQGKRFPGYRSGADDDNDINYYFFGKLCPTMAQFTGSPTVFPFGSWFVGGNSLDTTCMSKGTVQLDLLSYNCAITYNIALFSTAANGKYLLALKIANNSSKSWMPEFFTSGIGGSYTSKTTYHCIYVGWDPSNPDITQASAWTEYTE